MDLARNSAPTGKGYYIPTLDGWRALSIILVLGSHSSQIADFPSAWKPAFKWIFDGELGVRCFFLISGFLITTLMLREASSNGGVDLRSFYLRRTLRIVPVYLAFLLVVLLLQWLTPFEQTSRHWLHLLTFTSNYTQDGNWPTGHFWSLACEEQFYLVWPLLFTVLALFRPSTLAWVLLAIPILICPLLRVGIHLGRVPDLFLFSHFSILRFLDSLSFGCLLAYLLPRLRQARLLKGALVIPLALALIAIPHVLSRLFILGIITVPLAHTLQAAGMFLLLACGIVRQAGGVFRLLELPVITWLGRLSYSLYIWQQLFCTSPSTFGFKQTWLQGFPGWILASLLAAIVSYYLLERPLLKLRKRLHGRTPTQDRPANTPLPEALGSNCDPS